MFVAAALTVAVLAAPKSCGTSVDANRASICRRALPAIVPQNAAAEVLRVGSGPTADSVRVDYRLTGTPQADTKQRWIVCGFGAGLDSVSTESGPISGASVYLLKRYYLDTPEAAVADPGGR